MSTYVPPNWNPTTKSYDPSMGQTSGTMAPEANTGVTDRRDIPGGFLGLGHDNYDFYGMDPNAFKDPSLGANQQAIQNQIAAFGQRTPAQMQAATANGSQMQGAQLNQAQANQFRSGQAGLVGQLQQAAAGNGPSVAQAQFQQATDQSLASQMAMAKSGYGDHAIAFKNAAMNQAQIQQQAANQSGQLRAQEIMAARGQLGDVLSGARGQDLGAASTNAQLAEQTGQTNAQLSQQNSQFNAGQVQQAGAANLNAGIQQQQFGDQMVQKYLAMGLTLDQAQFQAQQDLAKTAFQGNIQQEAGAHGIAIQAGQQQAQGIGAVGSALGAIAATTATAASDERLKKDVKDGAPQVQDYLDHISAKSYQYKQPDAFGAGPQVGPLAQDLEQSPIGSQMVVNTPAGKMVDYGKGFGAIVAAQAHLNERLKALEALKGKAA